MLFLTFGKNNRDFCRGYNKVHIKLNAASRKRGEKHIQQF